MIDTIIIGVGPAGISAALNLRKINRSVLVLGKDKGQLSNLDVIDNLYGQGPIAGEQLITKGIKEARHLGIEIKNELVLNVAQSKDFFVVTTNKESYASKTVVLATGKPRIPLDIEGYQQFKSKGIHLCATCDGLLYKNKKIGIIGAGPYLMQELSTLENYTNDITIFTNGKPFSHDKYLVITDEVTAFLGEKRLTHLKTVNNTYPLSGTFL